MAETTKTTLQVSDQEVTSMRQNLNLLQMQVQAGQIDGPFLSKQIAKLGSLLERLEHEHRQLKRQSRLELLYNVGRLLGASLDLQTVLDQVMDAIIQLTGAERGFLMLRDDDGQVEVKAARGLDQQSLGSDKFKYSRTIVNHVLDTGESVVTTNASEDPRFAGQASIINQALRSIMATPLRVRGRVIGAVYVDNRAVVGLFEDDDLGTLTAFSGQAAMAIENAQLFSATDQQLAARIEELRQLRRIDLLLNETLDADKAMSYTLDWACRLSGATVGHMGLINDGRVVAVQHHGVNQDDTQPVYLDKAYPQSLAVARSGQTVIQTDPDSGQTVLIVPVRREQHVIGIVVLRCAGAFTSNQQDLVERVVARAAVAIENGRLYAAVQAADRAKSEFVGIVAHDLKVPMTSIMGYADLTIMDGNLEEEQIKYQNRIRDTVRRMELLVSDLADISRIESGHFFMNETRVNVDDIVQAVREAIMTQVKARQHAYIEEIEPDLPLMWVDYYRLLQVLTNLASNAYKYTPNGGRITLRVQRLEAERIQFTVADTGIGLAPEQIKKLGTKFWRADDEFTRAQPGTGLGFAITRSLVEQMGSHIQIQSQVGEGSQFTFSVAIAKE
ncbi:MAG: GAF domain-containing protein [Chloroflexi bacterium]|nr:GAF domain-containing protein [Chloroflexota bacterium]